MAVRIGGVPISMQKHVGIALTDIYGIGIPSAKKICLAVGVNPSLQVKDLSEALLDKLRLEVSDYKTEGNLRREVTTHRRRLEIIKCYRGLRHLRHLPVRGQRTRTNARTRKGPRRIIRKN